MQGSLCCPAAVTKCGRRGWNDDRIRCERPCWLKQRHVRMRTSTGLEHVGSADMHANLCSAFTFMFHVHVFPAFCLHLLVTTHDPFCVHHHALVASQTPCPRHAATQRHTAADRDARRGAAERFLRSLLHIDSLILSMYKRSVKRKKPCVIEWKSVSNGRVL